MKNYLEKVITAKTTEAEDIRSKVKNATTENSSVEEVRALGETLDKVLAELNDAKEQLAKLEEQPEEEQKADGEEVPKDEEQKAEGEEEEKPEEEQPAEEQKAEGEEDEEEPTSEDVKRSADWVKVDANNLKKVASFEQRGGNKMTEKEIKEQKALVEARAKDLIEGRTITVAASDILLPKHQSSDLATAPFKQVSTFVDLTDMKNLPGGESYEEPFVKSYGEGGTTEEGAAYTEAEPEFGSAEINKVKITAYAEFSEETEKLPAADYESEIRKGVEVALKKKMAQQQINGAGTSNTFTGILSSAENNVCVLAEDDIEISSFDQDTLNKIIFSYGGDEEVEQKAVLVLNKADLLALSLVRNDIGDHAYKIDLANQTINTIPYVINSNCKALSAATTNTGDYTMFYGIPKHYKTRIFSAVDIKKSYDYKFKEGKIAYKAVVFAGGNTCSYRGFIRIKKSAATQKVEPEV